MRVLAVSIGLLLALAASGCGGGVSDTDRRDIIKTLRANTTAQDAGDHATACAVLTSDRRRARTEASRKRLRALRSPSTATACGPVLDALERASRSHYRGTLDGATLKGGRLISSLRSEGERARRRTAATELQVLRTGTDVDLEVDGGTVQVGSTGTGLDGIELRKENGHWRIDVLPDQTSTLP